MSVFGQVLILLYFLYHLIWCIWVILTGKCSCSKWYFILMRCFATVLWILLGRNLKSSRRSMWMVWWIRFFLTWNWDSFSTWGFRHIRVHIIKTICFYHGPLLAVTHRNSLSTFINETRFCLNIWVSLDIRFRITRFAFTFWSIRNFSYAVISIVLVLFDFFWSWIVSTAHNLRFSWIVYVFNCVALVLTQWRLMSFLQYLTQLFQGQMCSITIANTESHYMITLPGRWVDSHEIVVFHSLIFLIVIICAFSWFFFS